MEIKRGNITVLSKMTEKPEAWNEGLPPVK